MWGRTRPPPHFYSCCHPLFHGNRTQGICLLHGLGSFFGLPYLLVDLCQGLIGKNHRRIHSNGLLHRLKSLIVAFYLAVRIGKVVIIIGIEGIAIDGVLVVFYGLIITTQRIIGGGELVITLGVVFKVLQQGVAGLNSIVITFHAVIGIGQASIGGSYIVRLQFISSIDEVLIGLLSIIVALSLQIGFRKAETRCETFGIKLNSPLIGSNSLISIPLNGTPRTQMLPGFGIIRGHRDDTRIHLCRLVAILYCLVNRRQ